MKNLDELSPSASKESSTIEVEVGTEVEKETQEIVSEEISNESRDEMNIIKGRLEERGVDLEAAHKDIMNNPDGELAGLKELEQSTRPVGEIKKITFRDRIKKFFER